MCIVRPVALRSKGHKGCTTVPDQVASPFSCQRLCCTPSSWLVSSQTSTGARWPSGIVERSHANWWPTESCRRSPLKPYGASSNSIISNPGGITCDSQPGCPAMRSSPIRYIEKRSAPSTPVLWPLGKSCCASMKRRISNPARAEPHASCSSRQAHSSRA